MRKAALCLMIGTMLAIGMLAPAENAEAQAVSTLVTFSPPNLPESIAIDNHGNMYVSHVPTHQVRKIAFNGTQTILASLSNATAGARPLLGIAIDNLGNVYAALNDSPETTGVWRITPSGASTLYAGIPSAVLLNALAFDKSGNLYVTDSITGTVYQIPRGGGAAQPWVSGDALLAGDASACGGFPPGPLGANGIAFNAQGDAFVLNTTEGTVVRIPVLSPGVAGTPQPFVGPTCDLHGADGLAFDNQGNLLVALNIQGKIVSISPEGVITTLASAPADPLYFPSAIAFGTGLAMRKQIFITNFAALGGTPGIVTMNAGVPGKPLP
jgi:sugar lactone lactonase YvrE